MLSPDGRVLVSPGEDKEAGFGLYDYNARYYSPVLGRFISPDTVVPEPENPQAFNRYGYTRNNPLKFIDPTGHAECWDAECEHRINPITKEFMGNKELTKSLLDDSEAVIKRPNPPNPGLGLVTSLFSTVADTMALAVSGQYALREVGGFVKGFAEGSGASPLVGLGAGIVEAGIANVEYQLAGNEWGDGLGNVSLAATALGDVLNGNTYIGFDQKEGNTLVIGSNTEFSAGMAIAGGKCPLAVCDAVLDGLSVYNDVTSLVGGIGPFKPVTDFILPGRINLPDGPGPFQFLVPHPPTPPNH